MKVVPGASRTRLAGRYGDGIKVQLAAVAERGRANAALITLLAKELGVSAGQVAILSGTTTPRKVVQVTGLSDADVRRKLGL